MATTHRIHLVRSSQVPPKPQPVEPADIASEVLQTVRECTEALYTCQEYQETVFSLVNAHLDKLEVVALRAMTQKARRS